MIIVFPQELIGCVHCFIPQGVPAGRDRVRASVPEDAGGVL